MGLAGFNITINGATSTPGEAHARARRERFDARPGAGSLSAFLTAHNDYVCEGGDCNNLLLTAPQALSDSRYTVTFVRCARAAAFATPFDVHPSRRISEDEKPSAETLQEWIWKRRISIAHVRNRGHFVLLVGWESTAPDVFYVNDPGPQPGLAGHSPTCPLQPAHTHAPPACRLPTAHVQL
jgi:hypothetical protein